MNDLEFVRRRLEIVSHLLDEAGEPDEDLPPWRARPDRLVAVDEPRQSPGRMLALERQLLLRLLEECRPGSVMPTLERWIDRNQRVAHGGSGERDAQARAAAGADFLALTASVLADLRTRLTRWFESAEEKEIL